MFGEKTSVFGGGPINFRSLVIHQYFQEYCLTQSLHGAAQICQDSLLINLENTVKSLLPPLFFPDVMHI